MRMGCQYAAMHWSCHAAQAKASNTLRIGLNNILTSQSQHHPNRQPDAIPCTKHTWRPLVSSSYQRARRWRRPRQCRRSSRGRTHPGGEVARWQNLIPSFPWFAPGWRAWGRNPRKGRNQILQLSVAEPWSRIPNTYDL